MSSGKDGDKKTSENQPKTPNIPLSARTLLSRQLGASSCPGRLPSLRPARDLSLQGASPKLTLGGKTKRTFTPTITSRKIKEEQKDDSSKAYDRRDKRQGEGRGRGRARGRGRGSRGRGEIIASQSVFSMGPAERNKLVGQLTSSVGFGGGEKREDKAFSKMSGKKEKQDIDYDDEESKKILKMLQTEDDDIGDEYSEYGMAPVSIPLSNYLQKIKETEDKKDIVIKDEPMDVDVDVSTEKPTIKPKPVKPLPVKTERKEATCSSLFNTVSELEEEKLLFLQFPDKLPIKPMKTDSNKQGSGGDQTKEKVNTNSNTDLTLKDVSEGYIGKLQVLKSGKTRLVLGDVTLDVAMGTSCSFLQELVSVHTDGNRSDMTVLGQIKHRIICTPDFEKLLVA